MQTLASRAVAAEVTVMELKEEPFITRLTSGPETASTLCTIAIRNPAETFYCPTLRSFVSINDMSRRDDQRPEASAERQCPKAILILLIGGMPLSLSSRHRYVGLCRGHALLVCRQTIHNLEGIVSLCRFLKAVDQYSPLLISDGPPTPTRCR